MSKITGTMIEEMITESYHKAIIAVTNELERITDNTETLGVACQLIYTDSYLIAASNNAEELQKNVLEAAKDNLDTFAGLDYNPCAFLDPDDPYFEGEDSGLSWVLFDTIWEAFEKAVEKMPTK